MNYLIYFRNRNELTNYIIKQLEDSIKDLEKILNISIFLEGYYQIIELGNISGELFLKRDLTVKKPLNQNITPKYEFEDIFKIQDRLNGIVRFQGFTTYDFQSGDIGLILDDGLKFSFVLDLGINGKFYKELLRLDYIKSYNKYDRLKIERLERIVV
jgi:hypothetical protein